MKYKIYRWLSWNINAVMDIIVALIILSTFCLYRPYWNNQLRYIMTRKLWDIKQETVEINDIFVGYEEDDTTD